MKIEELVKIFLEVNVQVKLYHWQTFSKPEHETLGEFYESWDKLTDKFVESYAGLYGRPKGGIETKALPYNGNMVQYMLSVAALLQSSNLRSIAPESSLQNILDEISGLASHTAFLLTMNK